MGRKAALLLLVLSGGCFSGFDLFEDQGWTVEALPEGDIEFRQKGQPVLAYRYAPKLPPGVPERFRRAGYVYPLFDAAGTDILDDFPRDHYHHRGISWMWPVVKIDGKRHDLWELKGIHQRFESVVEREILPFVATIKVQSGWYAGERRVVQETVSIGTGTMYEGDGDRMVFFELTLEATGAPVTLAGQPEGGKGYGGFGVRFAPHQDEVITTNAGRLTGDSLHQRFTWVDYSARFRGAERISGMTIIPSAANEGATTEWICRHYGYIGVNWPGLGEIVLEPGKPRTVSYIVHLHQDEVNPEEVNDLLRSPAPEFAGW